MTSTIRARPNPDWCKEGSDHPSAKHFPLSQAGRQASYYDPETEKFVLIDTCFGTHHLQFGEDEDDTLFFSGGGSVVGWINTVPPRRRTNRMGSRGTPSPTATSGQIGISSTCASRRRTTGARMDAPSYLHASSSKHRLSTSLGLANGADSDRGGHIA